jgi:sec-independent protein translocase protein TatA
MQFVSPVLAGLPHTRLPHTLAWGMPHGYEWIVIGLIALLIFGKRLPGMARGMAQGIVEFKRGIKGAEAEAAADTQPKFDVQTGKPLDPVESTKAA